ncbi:Tryptophan synthase alpha chain [Saccharolobus shibatae B12]|uniref:Tryptophan synthase alpha chain n=3 Tax=Saccharolobus shibatae TaxID=2286 RepID=A0A8F5BQY6_SACSH|nr:Tryptophan synthase alpha chain [Saccharolobus shibatae B12]QXJ32940.1 Tryptophan synthase alpha chain [Saccharolobus shibatae]
MEMGKLLVVYMTLGYPNVQSFKDFIIGAVENGADILELGIPPKYAKYDGPVIRKSYDKVKGLDIWPLIADIRKDVSVPIIALTYLEDWIDQLDNFLNIMRDVKLDGVLFPDLLIDYIDDLDKFDGIIKNKGLKNVIFTSPSVPDLLIHKVSKISDLFLYYGVRPTTGVPIPVSVKQLINRVRNLVENKLIVGFGLSSESDLRDALSAGADGIAIGTAFIEEIEKNGVESAINLVKKFRVILDEYK